MESPSPVAKTGNFKAVLLAAAFALTCAAEARAEATFTAEVDRRQIGADESVNLVLKIENDDGRARVEGLSFDAPDFEPVNEYNSSFVSSRYDGSTGQFTVVNSQKLTKVLRPLRTGTLAIRNIRIAIGGKRMSAPDITVYVSSPGQGTPPPRNYGGGGVGLRGAGKNSRGPNFLIRAEISKDKAYKGEQIVVSYYIYARVRLTNIEVTKWPELKGFLKEELEMPIVQSRLDHERVILDGTPYDRALLVRYAVYPLQEGKLRIDPLEARFVYFPQGGMDDGEDPFFQFFKQMNPLKSQARSEQITIDSVPLPADGRPSSFSGAVGDFSVSALADRTQLRANEAVNLKVLIQGKGNVAAVGEPKVKWPDGVELYDSKGSAKSSKGIGEKVFDLVLIPRAPGAIKLPPIEFSFFNPAKKAYVTQATEAIQLDVQPAGPSTGSAKPTTTGQPTASTPAASSTATEALRYLKAPGEAASTFIVGGEPFWRWISLLALLAFIFLIAWVAMDAMKKMRGRPRTKKSLSVDARWEALREESRGVAQMSWAELLSIYARMSHLILDSLEGLGVSPEVARSVSREDLRRLLTEERGIDAALWGRLERVLEHTEAVKYAGSGGSEAEKSAREALEYRVREARSAVEGLLRGRS